MSCAICKMFKIRAKHKSSATATKREQTKFAEGLRIFKEGRRITELIGAASDYTPELLELMASPDYISFLKHLNEG